MNEPVQFINPTAKNLKNFWRKVTKRSDEECWPWGGRRTRGLGYGQVHMQGKYTGAHRFSWMLHKGAIPDGLFVLHDCDNPRCVNPSHLFLGTHDENMADKVSKQRQPRGETHPLYLHPEKRPRGTAHGNAKLDDDKVREIRRRRSGGEAFESIAAVFSVSKPSVMNVCKGRTWVHVVGLALTLFLTGCAMPKGEIISITQSVIGIKIGQNPATQVPEVQIGFFRSTFQIVPTSKTELHTPAVNSSLSLDQKAFSTSVDEDFTTGGATPHGESVAKHGAMSRGKAPLIGVRPSKTNAPSLHPKP